MPPQTAAFVFENPAADYFEEAVTSFLALSAPAGDAGVSWELEGVNRNLRRCTLMAAMAAEAYANAFLALALKPAEAAAVDRVPTPAKFVLGPRLAVGSSRLETGSGPLQTVSGLFKRRNHIVHAHPQRVPVHSYGLRSDPKLCARSLVAVAECVRELNECLEETEFMGPVEHRHDLGDEIDADAETIDAERTYYYTGGLIHLVIEHTRELEALGQAITDNDASSIMIPDLAAEGRRRERQLMIQPER
jgi:hypothetical protein